DRRVRRRQRVVEAQEPAYRRRRLGRLRGRGAVARVQHLAGGALVSLLTHPVIASARTERDVEHPVVEAPALDTHVVEDGDVMAARHIRTEWTPCNRLDSGLRRQDRRDLDPVKHQMPVGAHRIKAHMYAVIVAEKYA